MGQTNKINALTGFVKVNNNMTDLRKQFKTENPETVGETDQAFDNHNYIEWLEAKFTGPIASDLRTRLEVEKSNLNDKIKKLEAFQESSKFQGIDPVQMTLLNCQVLAMRTYSQILLERIARVPVEA